MLAKKQAVAIFLYLNIIYIALAAYPYALRCRKCERAAYVTECHEWVECGDHEVCYMDQVITSALLVYYNAGCRAKNFCEKSVGQTKRENVFISCSRCCNDEPFCNEQLCSIPTDTDAVMCYQCGFGHGPGPSEPTRYPADCDYIGQCNPGEACYVKATTDHEHEGQLLHYSKCMPYSVCQYVMASVFEANALTVGRRDPSVQDHNVCSVCCGDDRCNGFSCNTIKQRLKSLYESGFLNVTTLREIY